MKTWAKLGGKLERRLRQTRTISDKNQDENLGENSDENLGETQNRTKLKRNWDVPFFCSDSTYT